MQKGIQQDTRDFTSIHEVSFFEANLIPKHGCAPANPDGQSTNRFTVGEVRFAFARLRNVRFSGLQ